VEHLRRAAIAGSSRSIKVKKSQELIPALRLHTKIDNTSRALVTVSGDVPVRGVRERVFGLLASIQ
jgi:hypothetical protein